MEFVAFMGITQASRALPSVKVDMAHLGLFKPGDAKQCFSALVRGFGKDTAKPA